MDLALAFSVISKGFGLPVGLLSAVCFVESTHRTTIIHNDNGSLSIGICQLKEATAKQMGHTGHSSELLVPEVNLYYSARYLAKQIDRYDGDIEKGISAYNAGRYKASNKKYVNKVMKAWKEGR